MARTRYSKAGMTRQGNQPSAKSQTHFRTRARSYSIWQGRHKPSYNPPIEMSIPAIKRRWARYTSWLKRFPGGSLGSPVQSPRNRVTYPTTCFFPSDFPPAPAALHTLPQELFEQDIAPLDRRTILVLYRTSSSLQRRLDNVIWRHLDISLHPHFGKHPIIIGNDHFWSDRWTVREYRASYPGLDIDERIKAHLVRVLRTINKEANAGRRTLVRSLRIAVHDQVLHQQVDMIKNVAPTLQSLELVNDDNRSYWDPDFDGDCLDSVMLERYDFENRTDRPDITLEMLGQPTAYFGLIFPSLTTVIIRAGAVRFAEFIILLLRMAPNVEHLEFDAGGHGEAKYFKERLEGRGINLHTTKIQHMRLSLSDRYFAGSYTPVLALLENSPLVERLSLDYQDYSLAGVKRARALVSKLQNLQELQWRMDWKIQGVAELLLPSLRRLTMPLSGLYPSFSLFSSPCPKLEIAIFDRSPSDSHRDRHVSEWSTMHPSVQLLPPDFALWLRAYPLLHSISFVSKPPADLLAEATPTVKIHSIRHGDKEVLRVKMLSRARRHGDGAQWAPVQDDWRSEDDAEKCQRVWVTLTDYKGKTVPLHVLEEMRRVEGAKEEEWEGRGLTVERNAWQVLLDWYGSSGGQA